MNREEKEQYVIQLYQENKSIREIAKLMHMSFSGIAAITKKVKLEADRKRGQLEQGDDDIKSKSKITQAIKLFSEFKSPIDVIIALDLPANQVREIYLEYLELDGMNRLAKIYEEAKYDLDDLLRLHRIVKVLGLEKHDIISAFELIKHNQLETLQAKVQNLRNDMDMLENEKTKAASTLFRLKRMIGEAEESLAQKRREITHLNQESGKSDNTSNSDPVTYSEPDTSSDSIE
jgi:hypothetical protein